MIIAGPLPRNEKALEALIREAGNNRPVIICGWNHTLLRDETAHRQLVMQLENDREYHADKQGSVYEFTLSDLFVDENKSAVKERADWYLRNCIEAANTWYAGMYTLGALAAKKKAHVYLVPGPLDTSQEKLNGMTAYVRGLAKQHGRKRKILGELQQALEKCRQTVLFDNKYLTYFHLKHLQSEGVTLKAIGGVITPTGDVPAIFQEDTLKSMAMPSDKPDALATFLGMNTSYTVLLPKKPALPETLTESEHRTWQLMNDFLKTEISLDTDNRVLDYLLAHPERGFWRLMPGLGHQLMRFSPDFNDVSVTGDLQERRKQERPARETATRKILKETEAWKQLQDQAKMRYELLGFIQKDNPQLYNQLVKSGADSLEAIAAVVSDVTQHVQEKEDLAMRLVPFLEDLMKLYDMTNWFNKERARIAQEKGLAEGRCTPHEVGIAVYDLAIGALKEEFERRKKGVELAQERYQKALVDLEAKLKKEFEHQFAAQEKELQKAYKRMGELALGAPASTEDVDVLQKAFNDLEQRLNNEHSTHMTVVQALTAARQEANEYKIKYDEHVLAMRELENIFDEHVQQISDLESQVKTERQGYDQRIQELSRELSVSKKREEELEIHYADQLRERDVRNQTEHKKLEDSSAEKDRRIQELEQRASETVKGYKNELEQGKQKQEADKNVLLEERRELCASRENWKNRAATAENRVALLKSLLEKARTPKEYVALQKRYAAVCKDYAALRKQYRQSVSALEDKVKKASAIERHPQPAASSEKITREYAKLGRDHKELAHVHKKVSQDYERTRKDYEHLVRDMVNVGYYLVKQDVYRQGIRACQTALSYAKETKYHSIALYNEGVAFYNWGIKTADKRKVRTARNFFAQVLKLEPRDAGVKAAIKKCQKYVA